MFSRCMLCTPSGESWGVALACEREPAVFAVAGSPAEPGHQLRAPLSVPVCAEAMFPRSHSWAVSELAGSQMGSFVLWAAGPL